MRRVLIVGGGQSGLQLALCLLEHDYDVTLMTVHNASELYAGRAVSAQILYDKSRGSEREYGLNFWDEVAPPLTAFRASSYGSDGTRFFDWIGRTEAPAHSIDERVKMSVWLEILEERGGKVVLHGATGSDLDHLTRMFDLTIVAAGHSGLADMFSVDTSRELARMPPVATAIAYVEESPDHPDQEIGININPELGHLATWPAYSVNGRCSLMLLTGRASGPMSRFPQRISPQEHLELMLQLMAEYFPHRHREYRGARLADDRAVALDHTHPLVRHPIAHLPSGGSVLGMGDTVVVTSVAMLQEANNAAMAAKVYLDAILEHGDRPFDGDFMQSTFDRYMEYAQYFTGAVAARLHLTTPDVTEFCMAADTHPSLADRFGRDYGDPPKFAEWFAEEADLRAMIAEAVENTSTAGT
ncbi:MAG: FAD-binding oxidoreductase [Nocardiopsaceae bacterium]|nr:FAD-binding oxidoreductase [Nocardiopsaceae bacterium]